MEVLKKHKNRGVKARQRNFEFRTINKKLKGIYYYLAIPKNSTITSQEEADEFILSFCKYWLGFEGSLNRCSKVVQDNFETFKEAVKLNL